MVILFWYVVGQACQPPEQHEKQQGEHCFLLFFHGSQSIIQTDKQTGFFREVLSERSTRRGWMTEWVANPWAPPFSSLHSSLSYLHGFDNRQTTDREQTAPAPFFQSLLSLAGLGNKSWQSCPENGHAPSTQCYPSQYLLDSAWHRAWQYGQFGHSHPSASSHRHGERVGDGDAMRGESIRATIRGGETKRGWINGQRSTECSHFTLMCDVLSLEVF